MRVSIGLLIISAALFGLVSSLPAQVCEPAAMPDFLSDAVSAPPLRVAESQSLVPFATLPPASEGAQDQLVALHAWNSAHKEPK
jgi:hypothetical protein